MKTAKALMSVLIIVGICLFGMAFNVENAMAQAEQRSQSTETCHIFQKHPCVFAVHGTEVAVTMQNESDRYCEIHVLPTARNGWSPTQVDLEGGETAVVELTAPEKEQGIYFYDNEFSCDVRVTVSR